MNTLVERIGWTLVHSLWEGGVIWVGLQLSLVALRRQSAQLRYLAGCGALGLAMLLPLVTFLYINGAAGLDASQPGVLGVTDATNYVQPTGYSIPVEQGWGAYLEANLEMVLPCLVLFWVIGCAWKALQLTTDWVDTRRLAAEVLQPLPEAVARRCRELAERLGIKRMVRLGESALVDVPSVFGWLKPVILVPVGAFSGLSGVQIDALLAHELAHIFRHDFPVNVLQSICEVLFFFNPAVVAINRIIRRERENACDDIAVALTGSRLEYANALTLLEEARHPPLLLAASGQGELFERIRRLAFGSPNRISFSAKCWIAFVLALIAAGGTGYWQARGEKLYSATATMQFDRPATVVTTQGVMDASVRSDYDINTYIQDLQSNKVRQLVVDSLTDDEKQTILRPIIQQLPAGHAPPTVDSGMLGRVIIDKVPGTFLLRITIQNEDPDAAALVANEYVQTFMHYLMNYTGDSNEYAVTYLKDRADSLQKESEEAEAKLGKYMKEKNLVSLDGSMNLAATTMLTMQKALDDAKISQINLNTIAKEIESNRGGGGMNLLDIQYVAQHGRIPALRTQLEDLQGQPTANDFDAKAIDARIATTRRQLDQEISQAIADLQSELNATTDKVRDFTAAEETAEKREFDLMALKTEFSSLVTQRDVAKNNYMSILDRLNQTQTSKNLQNVPLHPLDTAVAPAVPFRPDVPRIVRSSIYLGVIVFLSILAVLTAADLGRRAPG